MANIRVVPKFIEASTKDGLTRAMLAYQVKRSGVVKIITINQDVKSGRWVCWFHDEYKLPGDK